MSTLSCPRCQAEGMALDANFCQRCGGTMRGVPCPKCHAATVPGDQFCNKCGGTVPNNGLDEKLAGAGAGNMAPWALSGLLALTLAAVLIAPWDRGGRNITMSAPPGATSAGLGQAPNVDLGSMTPREAATRLFDRVMRAVGGGDMNTATQFLPMAIAAYDRIEELNLDDRFHLSLLHAAAGDGSQALAIAEVGLQEHPTHLLVLAAAAEATILLGEQDRAIAYYETFLESYDAEMATELFEYGNEAHQGDLMESLKTEAENYLISVGRGGS